MSIDNCYSFTLELYFDRLVDCFLVDEAVTSLAFSPTNDFLATSHVDDLGIYLWSNITLYKHVALKPLPSNYQPQLIEMPTTAMLSEGMYAHLLQWSPGWYCNPVNTRRRTDVDLMLIQTVGQHQAVN